MSAGIRLNQMESLMKRTSFFPALAAARLTVSPLAAQSGGDGAPPVERTPSRTERADRPERVDRSERATARAAAEAAQPATAAPDARTLLGLVLSSSGNARDTLGLLVSVVITGGPADRAGIEEGNRIAAINGVNLRVDAAAAGDRDAADVITRRFDRELADIRVGDEVSLRVMVGGRSRTVTLEAGSATRTARDDRDRTTARDGGRDSEPAAPTLDAIADAVAKLQQQIRQLAAKEEVPGLDVSQVADEMVVYFGEGSESGLLVLKADRTWDPLRPGDVILRIDDQVVTLDRLRAAPNARRGATIELMRRKRIMTVTLAQP